MDVSQFENVQCFTNDDRFVKHSNLCDVMITIFVGTKIITNRFHLQELIFTRRVTIDWVSRMFTFSFHRFVFPNSSPTKNKHRSDLILVLMRLLHRKLVLDSTRYTQIENFATHGDDYPFFLECNVWNLSGAFFLPIFDCLVAKIYDVRDFLLFIVIISDEIWLIKFAL